MSMGNFNPDVLRQAQSVQKNLMRLREELKERVVEADSGGGLVKAFTNGNGELVKLTISPDAIDPDDLGMLEDLVVAAVLKSQEVQMPASEQVFWFAFRSLLQSFTYSFS